MDTFRLNPDAVRRALPDRLTEAREPDEQARLAGRVREVEPRVEGAAEAPPAAG